MRTTPAPAEAPGSAGAGAPNSGRAGPVTAAVLVLAAAVGCLAAAWLLAWRRAHDPYGRQLHCAESGARVPAGAGVCPRCRSPHLEGGPRAVPGRPARAPAARADPHRPRLGWAEAVVSDALRVEDAVDPWAGPGDPVASCARWRRACSSPAPRSSPGSRSSPGRSRAGDRAGGRGRPGGGRAAVVPRDPRLRRPGPTLALQQSPRVDQGHPHQAPGGVVAQGVALRRGVEVDGRGGVADVQVERVPHQVVAARGRR